MRLVLAIPDLISSSYFPAIAAVDLGCFADEGLDVELQNWRGVVAPKGISPEQAAALEGLLVDMTRTPTWKDALARRGWEDATLAGPPFAEFVDSEQARVTQVLTEIGLG